MMRPRAGAGALIALLGAWLSAGAGCTAPPTRERPPNVILYVADDLGWAELGCYGQAKIRTPHIDAMAAEGLRFTQFYAGAPVCAPSRCTLLTGRHTGHAFIRDNREIQPEGQLPIPDEVVTLGERMQAAGYVTGVVGKWGLGGPGSEGEPNRQGFDHWFGYLCQRQAHNFYPRFLWRNGEKVLLPGNDRGLTGEQYSHDLVVDEALGFIREHSDEPFFLLVADTVPHLAIQVPDDSLAEYEGTWDDPPYEGGKGYLPHPAPRAGYAAMVSRMDRSVGRVLALVDELGLDEDTLVMFTSDNGPTYDRIGGSDSAFFESAGPLRGLKGSVYEGGLRVPLVARWPGHVPAGETTDRVAAFWDVMPTLLQLAGRPVPADLDGESLASTLRGEPVRPRSRPLYWELRGYGGQQAVRSGDWKAVRRDLKSGSTAIELYDLARDAGEREDVAGMHPEIVQRLSALMSAQRSPSEAFPLRW
ncbi:MAG: arylsulfatase [Planctomycetota bacterium]